MTERMSAQQYRDAIAKPKRGNKFGAKRTVFDGITFDSKREAEVYRDLKMLERAGSISGFERQRKFELIVNGKIIGTYRADFCFIDHDQDGRFRTIDVKGVVTRDFRRVRRSTCMARTQPTMLRSSRRCSGILTPLKSLRRSTRRSSKHSTTSKWKFGNER